MRWTYLVLAVLIGAGATFLVGSYAFHSADTMANAWTGAFVFGSVTAGGLFAHLPAIQIWPRSKAWSLVLGVIAVFALLVSLSNSVGALAERNSLTRAERIRIAEQVKSDVAELSRLEAQRAAFPSFTIADSKAVEAANSVSVAAATARQAECEKRGPLCRDREADERNALTILVTVTTSKALSDKAAVLDGEITRLRQRIAEAGPIRPANPQGEALARILMLPTAMADTLSTWQQLFMTGVLEALVVGFLIAFEKVPRPTTERELPLTVIEPIADPAPIDQVDHRPKLTIVRNEVASVTKIMTDALEPAQGKRVNLEACFRRYRMDAKARGEMPVSQNEFIEGMANFCREVGISTKITGTDVYLVGVQIGPSPRILASGT